MNMYMVVVKADYDLLQGWVLERNISSFRISHFMLDFSIAGPIVGIFAILDVTIHLHLDIKKSRKAQHAIFQEPSTEVSSLALIMAAISTLLSFLLVLCFPLVWILEFQGSFLILQIPFLSDVPVFLWSFGLIILLVGIIVHAWSRYERQEMASSWKMRDDQKLITTGPYSRVRHPSYTSYFLSIIGLFMMMPSVITSILFIGFWGYSLIAINEEKELLKHFGGAYKEYMKRTGRFFPKISRYSYLPKA